MAKKYSFPELECRNCEHFQRVGDSIFGTRYCGGFPRRRKPKRFSSSDPQYKAPKWCPRRLWPSVCRIYGFADEQSEFMDTFVRERIDLKRSPYAYPTESNYKLRHETIVPMKAKDFFESVSRGDLDDFLVEADIQMGEVIEIDDGLKPYYFYCMGWSRLVPVLLFDRSRVEKGEK